MIIKKIIYNNGKNEGYFVETIKGFVQIIIKEGQTFRLKDIKKEIEIKINQTTTKIESNENETYIN